MGVRNKNNRVYTIGEVLGRLRSMQGARRLGEFARQIRVTPHHLREIFAGKRAPGMKVLQGLGMGRRKITRTVYFDLKANADTDAG